MGNHRQIRCQFLSSASAQPNSQRNAVNGDVSSRVDLARRSDAGWSLTSDRAVKNNGCPPSRLLSHRLQGSRRPDPRLQGRGSRRRRRHRPALRPPHEDGARRDVPPFHISPKPSGDRWAIRPDLADPTLTSLPFPPPQNPLVTELSLYDIAGTPGVAADVSHVNTGAQVKVRAR